MQNTFVSYHIPQLLVDVATFNQSKGFFTKSICHLSILALLPKVHWLSPNFRNSAHLVLWPFIYPSMIPCYPSNQLWGESLWIGTIRDCCGSPIVPEQSRMTYDGVDAIFDGSSSSIEKRVIAALNTQRNQAYFTLRAINNLQFQKVSFTASMISLCNS